MRKLIQPVLDKLQAWNRNRKYKENSYFRIAMEVESEGILPIELLQGPFKGIIYTYGSVNIGEDLGYMGAKASFDVTIVKSNDDVEPNGDGYAPIDHTLNPEFGKITGQILLVILEKAIKKQADKFYEENLNEEVREDYIEEPVPSRTVRKKNSAVSKKRVPAGKKRKKSVRRSSKVRPPVQPDSDV